MRKAICCYLTLILIAPILTGEARDGKTSKSREKVKAAAGDFNGLEMNLGALPRLSNAQSRSISAENPNGEKGKGAMAEEGYGANAAKELGQGWKVSPAIYIDGGDTVTLADIEGSGAIQSIWMTGNVLSRDGILRFYWDGQERPSVEVPACDFFCSAWGRCSRQLGAHLGESQERHE